MPFCSNFPDQASGTIHGNKGSNWKNCGSVRMTMAGTPVGRPLAVFILAAVVFFCGTSQAEQGRGRFFLMGSGHLHLKNLRNNETAQVSLLNGDGSFNDEGFRQVDRVFGYLSAQNNDHISPRLLFMLSYFADRAAPGQLIIIESGYRSPEYNEAIRVNGANAARTSTHIDAMALDFRIAGVDGKKLWETIRSANCCGAGHYGGDIIHLDAGRPRFWEAKSSGTRSREPDENRHIFLSADFDRYPRQAPIRLTLSGISTFGFGINPEAVLFDVHDPEKPAARMRIVGSGNETCRIIKDRTAARFLTATLPAELQSGRYRIKLEFCKRPFARMPAETMTQEIELFEGAQSAGS